MKLIVGRDDVEDHNHLPLDDNDANGDILDI